MESPPYCEPDIESIARMLSSGRKECTILKENYTELMDLLRNVPKEWWLYGKEHRVGGPAIEYADGEKEWYFYGKKHRENGPAIEHSDGYQEWCIHDILHRKDGPRKEYPNGHKEWYLHGRQITERI